MSHSSHPCTVAGVFQGSLDLAPPAQHISVVAALLLERQRAGLTPAVPVPCLHLVCLAGISPRGACVAHFTLWVPLPTFHPCSAVQVSWQSGAPALLPLGGAATIQRETVDPLLPPPCLFRAGEGRGRRIDRHCGLRPRCHQRGRGVAGLHMRYAVAMQQCIT